MSDVCEHCPHAILDHEDTGCISCKCGSVYFPADPEPTPVVPETEPETGTVVPEPKAKGSDAKPE